MLQGSVISKHTHISSNIDDVNGYKLNTPSVLNLDILVSNIAKIKIINGDLVIEMLNGEIVKIQNFKDNVQDLDNSLVLQNGDSLVWVTFNKAGNYEVNPKYDYLGLKAIDDLLYSHEESSNLMPWIIAGGAVAAGALGLASGGSDGKSGKDGQAGKDGQDAIQVIYEFALANGFNGTQNEILEIIISQSTDGKSAYDLAVEKGFTGTVDSWVASLQGAKGIDGKSAYEIAKSYGFDGTEKEWLQSLSGKDGESVILLNTPVINSNKDGVLTGTAEAGTTVNLYNSKGIVIGSALTDTNGVWTISNTLAANEVGMIIATNDKGHSSFPLPIIEISIPEVTQPIPIIPPKPITSVPVITEAATKLKGTSDAGAIIEVKFNGNTIAQTTADQDGNWGFLPNPLQMGTFGTVIATLPEHSSSNMVVVNGFVQHITNVPDVDDDGENLSGSAEPDAIVRVYSSDFKLIDETLADVNGHWSFKGNPIADNSNGYVTAEAPYKTESNVANADGLKIPELAEPTITYNNEDGLSGKAHPNSKLVFSSLYSSQKYEVNVDDQGFWSIGFNPSLNDNRGWQITTTLDGYKPSKPINYLPEDTIAPQLDLNLQFGFVNIDLNSLNYINDIHIVVTSLRGGVSNIGDSLWGQHEWTYNFKDYSNIGKVEIYAKDSYGNSTGLIDVTQGAQWLSISKVDNFEMTGLGLPNSNILLTQISTGVTLNLTTNSTGEWNISIGDLVKAGIDIYGNANEYTYKYADVVGKPNIFDYETPINGMSLTKYVPVEIVENNEYGITVLSKPNSSVVYKYTQNGMESYVEVMTDSNGYAKVSYSLLNSDWNQFGQINDFVFYPSAHTPQNSPFSTGTVAERLDVKLLSETDQVFQFQGVPFKQYEIDYKGEKTLISMDFTGVYTVVPNPFSVGMYTIDRITTNGEFDIPPQIFGQTIESSQIIANKIYEILDYADDLGGNEIVHHDVATQSAFHFNVSELISNDYNPDKDIHDFLSTIVTNNQDGTISTSVIIDRDGDGDKFHQKALIVLDNTALNIDDLINNGTILF